MGATDWIGRQRAHFENHVGEYFDLYTSDSPFHTAVTNRLLSLVRAKPGSEILDVGCGPGRTTLALLQAGYRVVGLDLSQSTLDKLTDRLRKFDLADHFQPLCQPVEELRETGRFAAVIGRGVLHHLEDPIQALIRIRTSLVPGGRVVFMDPNPLQPAWIPYHTFHPTLSWAFEKYLFRHTPWYNRRIMLQVGFDGVEIQHAGAIPPPFWRWSLIRKRLVGLEDRIRRLPGIRSLSLYQITVASRP